MSPTIIRLAFSSLLGRTRSLGLLALPVALLVIAAIARATGGGVVATDGPVGRVVLSVLGMTIVVPMLSLLVSTRLLGNEVEDGTIYYLLATPVPRRQVVLGKLVAAVTTSLLLGALPMVLASLVLDHTDVVAALGWGIGAAAACVAYSGLFLGLSATTRHAVVVGLLYVMVWEGTLRGLLTGINKASVSAWSTLVAGRVGDMSVVEPSGISLPYAVVALALVLALGTTWATHRLRGLSLTGD